MFCNKSLLLHCRQHYYEVSHYTVLEYGMSSLPFNLRVWLEGWVSGHEGKQSVQHGLSSTVCPARSVQHGMGNAGQTVVDGDVYRQVQRCVSAFLSPDSFSDHPTLFQGRVW